MAPKLELILSWVDYWTDTYGKFTPHKTAVVINAANKEVRPAICEGGVRTCYRLTTLVKCLPNLQP